MRLSKRYFARPSDIEEVAGAEDRPLERLARVEVAVGLQLVAVDKGSGSARTEPGQGDRDPLVVRPDRVVRLLGRCNVLGGLCGSENEYGPELEGSWRT